MEGRILSHYRILTHLGGGGMGVVYKAEDTRLKRPVALKFLPPELTRDPDSRERFMFEAQSASLLDHPNICTIYEIDTADDGQLFIAMAFIDGETLKKRLQRGPVSIAEAIDIAIQIARGLDKAHHASIVHRDVKPANIMLTHDGLVKLVDFGVAKLMDRTGVTRTGSTVGTVAYMAPEQIQGGVVDQRTDIWAMGVVLYEMLAGRLPFGGEHEMAMLNNIVNQTPPSVASLRPDVPTELQQIVARAMAKRAGERYGSAGEVVQDLLKLQAAVTNPGRAVHPNGPVVSRRLAVAGAAVILLLAAAPTGWLIKRNLDARHVDSLLAEAAALADKDNNMGALARAEEATRVGPGDSRLDALMKRISVQLPIKTRPDGADVYMKAFDDVDGAWKHVGRTPTDPVRLPVGMLRWKVEKSGFDTREFIASTNPSSGTSAILAAPIALSEAGQANSEMLPIEKGNLTLTLTGYDFMRPVPSGDFLIDKYEVTNKQFKAFVDAGGYARRDFWKQPFAHDGHTLTWEQAVAQFHDRTDRPGPSTWEVGTFPRGQDDYPVGGVSWYEAAAYAEFAGKSLPTIYHWLRAAVVGTAAYMMPFSNLEGTGPAPVGKFPGVTPTGAFDMAGNVKEWCWNELPGKGFRYLLGASWTDAPHLYMHPDGRSPFDRSDTNGFRLVKYLDPKPLNAALTEAVAPPTRDLTNRKPVPDDVYKALSAMYDYDPRPLEAKVESTEDLELWVRQKVSFRTAYGDERMSAFIFLPKNARPPFKTVIYAPGANAVQPRPVSAVQPGNNDFLLVSGRALVYPVYKGTFDRNTGETSVWPVQTRAYEDWMIQVVNDVRRTVDYLLTRDDLDGNSLSYYSISWGSYFGTRVLPLEPRFKSAILSDGGLDPGDPSPAVDTLNFVGHISVPVLMVNGDSDFIFPTETLQKPLFARLGTPGDRKRHVILHSGHGVLAQQRSQVVKEVLDWLDRYQGPVAR